MLNLLCIKKEAKEKGKDIGGSSSCNMRHRPLDTWGRLSDSIWKISPIMSSRGVAMHFKGITKTYTLNGGRLLMNRCLAKQRGTGNIYLFSYNLGDTKINLLFNFANG